MSSGLSPAWMQTASGKALDLLNPAACAFDIRLDIAEPLARLARFTGQVQAGPYSVAQHSVIGADALFRETGRPDLALMFLVHDAHEAFMGDIATPLASALATLAEDYSGHGCGAAVTNALHVLKTSLDDAIHRRLRLPFPPAEADRAQVRLMDLRMLRTERDHLLARPPWRWSAAVEATQPIRITGRLRCWPWPDAADQWMDRLARYGGAGSARERRPRPDPFPPKAAMATPKLAAE